MSLKEIIEKRESRRSFTGEPLSPKVKEPLEQAIWNCNQMGEFRIELVEGGAAFSRWTSSYGMFSGVTAYLAMIGPKNNPVEEEKIGYFGQSLVLLAEELGLGTCWVSGSYDPKQVPCRLNEDEEVKIVIVIGPVPEQRTIKERIIRSIAHRGKVKEPLDFFESPAAPPSWVVDGLKLVALGPSAVNKQPVYFTCEKGVVRGYVPEGVSPVELGIAKLHFQVGAKEGQWDFGNGGGFYEKEEKDLADER